MILTPYRNRERLLVGVLLLLCLVLFFYRLDARPLWDIDEGMHAATSKDMVLSGDWVIPRYNGEAFYDKPILYNWLAALSFMVLGFSEFAARLPAALLGTGCVLATYALGRRLYGPLAAFTGAAVLATSAEFIILSRTVVHDISLAFCTTLALACFYAGYTDRRHRSRHFLLMYAAGGFGLLAKGPLGLVLPALVIGLFLLTERRLSMMKQMKIGWGALIVLAIGAPWYLMVSARDPSFAWYFFVEKNIGSFLGIAAREVKHTEPFYYYFEVLLGGFFPWSFFLPLAAVRAWRGCFKPLGAGTRFLLIWFAALFVFFSMAKSKLPTYLLPLFPAVALLVGALFAEAVGKTTKGLSRGLLFSFLPLVLILVGAGVYVFIAPPTGLPRETGIGLDCIHALAPGVVGLNVLSLFLLFKKRHAAAFGSIVTMVVCVLTAFNLFIVPSINPYRSTKALAFEIDRLLEPGEPMVFYRRERDSTLFYTDRQARVLRGAQQLKDFLDSDRTVYFMVLEYHLEPIAHLTRDLEIVAREGNTLLYSSRKAKPASSSRPGHRAG
jgi:4-amino-4-deoxy-L-arabinose transferase-like glycosyltransferase